LKHKFEQYQSVQKEIEDLESRIAKINKKNNIVSDTVQSSEEFPYTPHQVKITGIDVKKQALLEKYELRLKAFRDVLAKLRLEVEELIQQIDDSELRRILRYRYHDNFGWIKIMHLMEYNTESKARMKVERFFEKF